MNARPRRIVVAAATAVAVASGASAVYLSAMGSGAAEAEAVSPATAVFSPRRMPDAFRKLVADTRLAGRVNAVMRSLPPTSCVVVHAGDSTVVSSKPDQLLMPASALKLTTAAAFLAKLGGKGHFVTTVSYPTPSAGTVGQLVLTGGGDPLLATPGYVTTRRHPPRPATDFTSLIGKLRAAGITHVAGNIVVLDARFDSERRVSSWSPGYTATGDVGPIGALAVNDGFSSYAPLVAAPDPALAAGQELKSELVAAGIPVDGVPTRDATATGPQRDVSLESASYADVVGEMLTESDNNTAEALLKELARHATGTTGTRVAGLSARADALRSLGIDPRTVQAIDGSGLDRADRTTCGTLLKTMTTRPGGYDLEQMLAVAGQTGTLDDRFTGSPLVHRLRAKTGSLDGVTALVGVADPAALVKLRFAFISNGPFTDPGGKALQDRLVAALATYPEAPDAAGLAP